MDRIKVIGGNKLNGIIPISGAKNAALPLMIASLLTDDTLTLENFSATPSNLTVSMQGKDQPQPTTVVSGLPMAIETAGTVATGDQQAINLSKLSVSESQRRLVLQKVSDGPLVLTTGPAGFGGNGKLQVGADLAFVNSLVQAFSGGGQQVVAQGK